MKSIVAKFLVLSLLLTCFLSFVIWAIWFHRKQNAAEQYIVHFASQIAPSASPQVLSHAIEDSRHWFQMPFNAWMLDEEGRSFASSSLKRFPFRGQNLPLPTGLAEPEQFHPPGRRMSLRIYLLDGKPTRYLVIAHIAPKWWQYPIPITVVLVLIVSSLISASILIFYLRSKARTAEAVLVKLQEGDLTARLPVEALDELGRFSLKFNRMADEIEKLVKRVRDSERSRMEILEELAHDLRTPLTAILTLFESISDTSDVTPEYYKECISTALPEIAYVNRLIEDLFLLAQMNEPKYQPVITEIDLPTLVEKELRAIQAISHPKGKKITYRLDHSQLEFSTVKADAHLLQRLFRNLLLNARRFAEKEIILSLKTLPEQKWEACVLDDGRGFDPKILSTFGVLRPDLEMPRAGQESLGIGSIIIHSIVRLHGGTLQIANRSCEAGKTDGAEVRIRFPLSAAAQDLKAVVTG